MATSREKKWIKKKELRRWKARCQALIADIRELHCKIWPQYADEFVNTNLTIKKTKV